MRQRRLRGGMGDSYWNGVDISANPSSSSSGSTQVATTQASGPNNQSIYVGPAAQGIPATQFNGYVPVDYSYVYDTVLTANQVKATEGVTIYTDADWALTAIYVALNTGAFLLQIQDASGYTLMNAPVSNALFLQGTVPVPFPFVPAVKYPAGGRIGIYIADTSGAGNTIELVFRGFKMFAPNAS